jgi:hypothetical protein
VSTPGFRTALRASDSDVEARVARTGRSQDGTLLSSQRHDVVVVEHFTNLLDGSTTRTPDSGRKPRSIPSRLRAK